MTLSQFEDVASRVAMLARDQAVRGAPRLAGDALKLSRAPGVTLFTERPASGVESGR